MLPDQIHLRDHAVPAQRLRKRNNPVSKERSTRAQVMFTWNVFHFGAKNVHSNICDYHQDLQQALFHPGLPLGPRHNPMPFFSPTGLQERLNISHPLESHSLWGASQFGRRVAMHSLADFVSMPTVLLSKRASALSGISQHQVRPSSPVLITKTSQLGLAFARKPGNVSTLVPQFL